MILTPEPHESEFEHWRDEGCPDLGIPTCLDCPLPACRYDLPPKRAGALLRESKLRVLLAEGLTADEAALRMGVSRRTVFRLKRYTATDAELPVIATQQPKENRAMNQPNPNTAPVRIPNTTMTAPPASPSAPDWVSLARRRLDELTAEITTIEGKREEAQRLHAALTAFGVEGLPPCVSSVSTGIDLPNAHAPCRDLTACLVRRSAARNEEGAA